MATRKKKAKPFEVRKFVEAGWEFTETVSKNWNGKSVTQYFKSPRLERRYHTYYNFDDPLFTEDFLLDREFLYYQDELYNLAINEMRDIIKQNIEENYSRLTV